MHKTKIINKITDIETSVQKANIRQDLTGIVLKLMETAHNDTARCLTLPAKDWFFEHGIINAAKNSPFLQRRLAFEIDGVEQNKNVGCYAIIDKPAEARLTIGSTLRDFLRYEPAFGAHKVGVIPDTTLRKYNPSYDFIWADLCGPATIELINDFADMLIHNIIHGVGAITFCLKARPFTNARYLKRFREYSDSKDVNTAITETIDRIVRARVGKPPRVRRIYNVSYPGGKLGRVGMLTVAYSVNVSQAELPINITDNRRDEMHSHERKARYQLANNYINRALNSTGTALGRRKRKSDKLASKQAIREHAAHSAFGWNRLSREVKLECAKLAGCSLRQMAAAVAWHHGKLKNRHAK